MPKTSRRKPDTAKTSRKRPAQDPSIPALYAYLTVRDNDEGIIAAMTPIGITPLVASRRSEMLMMERMARRVCDGSQEPVTLVAFTRGRVMKVLTPRPPEAGEELVPLDPGGNLVASPKVAEKIRGLKVPEAMMGAGNEVADGGLRVFSEPDGDFILIESTAFPTIGLTPDVAIQVGENLIAEAAKKQGRHAMVTFMGTPEAMEKARVEG